MSEEGGARRAGPARLAGALALSLLGCSVAEPAAPPAPRRAAPPPDVPPACAPAPRCPALAPPDDTPLGSIAQYRRVRDILAGEDDRIDLAEVSLNLSQLLDEDLDIAPDLATLDRLADEARRATPRGCRGRCALRALVRRFLGRWRFRPVTDPNGLYIDPRYDLLHDVLASREGYCEGLSVAFLAVAQRLGLPVRGVLARQHLFVRYEGTDGVVDVDLTQRGDPPEPDENPPRCQPRAGVYGRSLTRREMAAQVVSVVGILDNIAARGAWIDAAVALAPNDADLRNNRGAEREARYDFDGAASDYRAAVAIDPCVSFYRVNHAGALRRAGRLDEAAQALAAIERDAEGGALESDPLYTSLARGDLAVARGDDALAEREYLRAVASSDGAPVAHEALGRLRLLRGEYVGAAESLLAALEREPGVRTRVALAEALIRGGDPNGRVELARAERDGADAEEISWLRALLAAAAGRRDEARERALRCLDRMGPQCLEAAVLVGDGVDDAACANRWYALASTCPLPPRDRERGRVEALARARRR
ncbi:MAG: transglutaminase family protein [Polyangiales bacterium]